MVDQRFSVSVHILTALAFTDCRKGDRMTSEQLAGSIRTNSTVVRRLVSRLVDAGILHAFKGKAGGVELARPPGEINLKEIYLASSGKALLQVSIKAPKKLCAVSCSMGKIMAGVIDGLESHSMKYLEGISVADLAKQVAK